MAKNNNLTDFLTSIADKIREKLGITDAINPQDFEDNIDKISDSSYETGYVDGQQNEYDKFWDNFQINGTRTEYGSAFLATSGANSGWNDENYKPKYDFNNLTNANKMFWAAQITNTQKPITIKDGADIVQIFGGSSIETIPLLKFEGDVLNFTNSFLSCTKLKNITIEGNIYKDISFSTSPLTVESAKSIINALCDYSGTDKEFTCKVIFSSTTKTLLEEEGATSPNGDTWLEYVKEKGWNC